MRNRERRAESFMESLRNAGYTVAKKPRKAVIPWATMGPLPEAARNALLTIFRELGGVPAYQSALAPRHWDMKADDVLVEFDEDLHFNRYRSRSLVTPWASQLPWSDAYGGYVVTYEDMCLRAGKHGKRWATRSANDMFGGSDDLGVLGPLGSSRWKQRAVYDAIKDAYALYSPGIALARVSIHDQIGGMNVNAATENRVLLEPAALRGFIESRTVPVTASS